MIRMPLLAPTPVPTITAVGVAKPRLHGHAIANTVIAASKATLIMFSNRRRGVCITDVRGL